MNVLYNSLSSVSFRWRRIEKVFTQNSATKTTTLVYDGADTVEETDQNGNVLAKYARTANIDEPLAESRSGATSYYEADGLGSVTSLSNAAGSLAQTYTHELRQTYELDRLCHQSLPHGNPFWRYPYGNQPDKQQQIINGYNYCKNCMPADNGFGGGGGAQRAGPTAPAGGGGGPF